MIVKPRVRWALTGSDRTNYEMATDPQPHLVGESVSVLHSDNAAENVFGTLYDWIPAEEYRGKRLKISGEVMTENVRNWAGLWFRMDADGKPLSIDNMSDRPIKGSQEWKTYEGVLDVPGAADKVVYGLLLMGPGHVRVRNIQFELVGQDVPVTAL